MILQEKLQLKHILKFLQSDWKRIFLHFLYFQV